MRYVLPFVLLPAILQRQSIGAEVAIDASGTIEKIVTNAAGTTDEDQQALLIRNGVGVDVSWPTHHEAESLKLYSERYDTFLNGCVARYGADTCIGSEQDRIAMNRRQPSYMKNFTYAGYAMVETPRVVMDTLTSFFEKYSDDDWKAEDWEAGDTYVNHWEVETQLLDIGHPEKGLSSEKQQTLLRELQNVLTRWSGVELMATSMYGIRSYLGGSTLAPHVDRLPLVISAIVNVAQDVYQPWPLEVIGHDGIAVNITIEPGTMILYESHSVIHGRPYPLEGSFYANLFAHFEPIGYTQRLSAEMDSGPMRKSAQELFEDALESRQRKADLEEGERSHGNRQPVPTIPPYLYPGTEEESRWKQEFTFHRDSSSGDKQKSARTEGVQDAHIVAANGNMVQLKELKERDPQSLHTADSNGWKPIHEAARGGNTEVLDFLITDGADPNERTNEGKGASPLWWAEHFLHNDHPAIRLLRRNGAIAIGPNQ
jgi:prolyl 4-hydroxylase